MAQNLPTVTAFALALGLGTIGLPVTAQTLLSGDHSVVGSLCAGSFCGNNETFGSADLKIKTINPELMFEDTSGGSSPSRDWRVITNGNGVENFIIEDVLSGRDVFVIEGAAESHNLYVTTHGRIGVRTSLPAQALHIAGFTQPAIRLDNGTNHWDIRSSSSFVWFQGGASDTFPFVLSSGAPSNSIWVHHDGSIGLGTETPGAPLELSSNESFNFFRITAEGATNDSVDITYTGGPLGSGQLRYNIVDGDNQEMSLDADGNMILDGTLTTSGPTCAGGCDRVFDADYTLLSIEEHAEAMFANRHLPAVGPTLPNAPVNMTEKMGNMLNELEHAHIYISQQHTMILQQDGELASQRDKIESLHTLVAALATRLETVEAAEVK